MRPYPIAGTDTPDCFTATLKVRSRPDDQYCLQIEAKLDGGWYWTVCMCNNPSLCASGRAPSRIEALSAAEARLDWMTELRLPN